MKLYRSPLLGATINQTGKKIYFFGGIFSQWHSGYIEDDLTDNVFTCAEQGMMFYKANLFNDEAAADAILRENDPSKQKALGRTIEKYDDVLWSKIRFDVVSHINYLKFSQSPRLKTLLIMSSIYELVEASPYDKIWGVGLAEDDPLIYDKKNWKGENLLGKAIMAARAKIISEL